ncbi:MAG TPA: phage terminase large subunit [Burkholderiales bacterium]|nr:phage terminase large subunit [Burkholderiales bacterium]
MPQKLKISPVQEKVLLVPETFDLFLGGGRGGAKSYALALLALRHVEQYSAKARVLYLRRSHKGCADFVALCFDLFGPIYGTALRFNAQEGLFRFPNGGTLEVNQIESASDYQKFQGRSFTLLLIDEAEQFPTPGLLDLLRSNLRGPKGVPVRCAIAANPGDIGHAWIAARYVFKAAPWEPFAETTSGRTFIYAPSTFLDNPFIDQDAYRRQLEASCPTDPELLRAWLEGDWTVARGAYFAAVLEESRNAVARWEAIPTHRGEKWLTYLCHDFGSSAPSVTYVVARSPGAKGPDEKFYARGSLVLVDELATNEPGNVSKGMGYTVPVLSEHLKEMCARWKVRPEGVADDAIFAKGGHGAGSISDEFRAAGVTFYPAKKADRISGWQVMRRLLQDAGKPDVPGLYVARHCEYFWATVPYLGRDPRRVEDVDSRGPDHAADAVRYGCLRESRGLARVALSGV